MSKNFIIVPLILVVFTVIFRFATLNKVNLEVQVPQTDTLGSKNPGQYFEEKDTTIKLLFVGDTMLARSIGDKILNNENPFKYVKSTFEEYDFVIANLETSVGDKGDPQPGKLYTFQAPIKSIEAMRESGIDIVSLANNHVMDYGDVGFLQMLELLDEAQIGYFGGGRNIDESFNSYDIEFKNTTIGLLGFNDVESYYNNTFDNTPGNAPFYKERIKNSIQNTSKNADIVLPFVHWGKEYQFDYNSRQREFAEIMVDAGADLVVGGHAHVIQPTEKINNIEVTYSLGNFVFDQMYLGAAKGNMLEIIISDQKIISTKLIPIYIDSEGFPNP